MGLLALPSLCPCSINAPSLWMDVLVELRLACLHVYCQFYFIYADPKRIRASFTCSGGETCRADRREKMR